MKVTTTTSSGEIKTNEIADLPEEINTSGYIDCQYNEEELDSSETLEAVETLIKKDIDEKLMPKMNRAQRRALAKKAGKKGRNELGTISETAKKLNYISLIQELRKLNEEKEHNKNEATIKNN